MHTPDRSPGLRHRVVDLGDAADPEIGQFLCAEEPQERTTRIAKALALYHKKIGKRLGMRVKRGMIRSN